jgi:hypothetical protein
MMARRGMHFKFNLGRTKGRGHKQPSSGGGALRGLEVELGAEVSLFVADPI